jgi:selenocysteine lyase/cysteine desulfurase
MYAYRLCQALGLDPDDGVVRASFVHYNTVEEIDRFVEVLEQIL